MNMSLIAKANRDWERITGNLNGFGVSLTFVAPNDSTAEVVGLATKHHLGVDQFGDMINSKQAHCSVSEKKLIDAHYPVRDDNDEVAMNGHLVTFNDSKGSLKTYKIGECYPDETIGVILFILKDYTP